MNTSQQITQFLYSHYFYAGLRSAIGVFGPALLLVALGGDLHVALVVSIGALCASVLDQPGPLRHKINEMLASTLFGCVAMVLTSVATMNTWLLGATVMLIGFVGSMFAAYGRKAALIGFAGLFMMAIAVDGHVPPAQVLPNALRFLAGGLGYALLTLGASSLRAYRADQQALAESLTALAGYVRIKAAFYDADTVLERNYRTLMAQQIVVADKQQVARDMVLRAAASTSPQGTAALTDKQGMLLRLQGAMTDLYEYVVAAHTDYELLRSRFGDADVMIFLRDLVLKLAQDLELIAYAVTRDRPARSGVRYQAELRAIEYELERLVRAGFPRSDPDAYTALRGAFNKMRSAISIVARLHAATDPHAAVQPAPEAARFAFAPFLSRQGYGLRPLLSQLTLQSPVLRHALRTTLALGTGFVLAGLLPTVSHRYWILLTIVIILKPSFGMTRQRNLDRLIGTAAGCLVAAALLHVIDDPHVLLAIMFACMVIGTSLLTLAYRISVVFTCTLVLLQFSVLMPGSVTLIGERILDTVLGSALAFGFSYLLPYWEYRALQRLVPQVLRANGRYLEAARGLYLRPAEGELAYRLARRGVHGAVAELAASFARMLHEPRSRQHDVSALHRFVLQSYLLASQIAGLAVFAAHVPASADSPRCVALLGPQIDAALRTLEAAERRFLAPASLAEAGEVAEVLGNAEAGADAKTGAGDTDGAPAGADDAIEAAETRTAVDAAVEAEVRSCDDAGAEVGDRTEADAAPADAVLAPLVRRLRLIRAATEDIARTLPAIRPPS